MSKLKKERIYTSIIYLSSGQKRFPLKPLQGFQFRELVFAIAILLKCITLPDVYPIENTCYP